MAAVAVVDEYVEADTEAADADPDEGPDADAWLSIDISIAAPHCIKRRYIYTCSSVSGKMRNRV